MRNPTQPTATRPLAIQKDGTWYCYGWDLTKNICEVYGQAGYIQTTYSYSPYGSVAGEGDVAQPLQWSSEYADPELGLVYYNYRYYNTVDGRWNQRDFYMDVSYNLYTYLKNQSTTDIDFIGLAGVNSFRYHVTEREEIFGHTFASGSLDELAKQASKISNKKIYELTRGVARITDSSSPIRGMQIRVFIRFECECDDGCFIGNFCASKPKIKTVHFVIEPASFGLGNAAHNMGFSNCVPFPPKEEYDAYKKESIERRVQRAEKRCSEECHKIIKNQ